MTSPHIARRHFLERFGVGAALAATGTLLAALLLAALVIFARARNGAVHRFDFGTEATLNRYVSSRPGEVRFWKTVTTVGDPTTLRVIFGVVVIVLLLRRRWPIAALIAVAMLGAAALSGVMKLAVDRARPVVRVPVDHVGGGSFPSGHALTSFVAGGLTLVLLLPLVSAAWRILIMAVTVVFVGAVGFSRLILGVHFVTDIIGGWLIGALWLAAVILVFRHVAHRREWRNQSLSPR